MPRSVRILASAVLVLWASWSVAGEEPSRQHNITIDDYFTLSIIEDVTVAPHGAWAAYVERRWDEDLDGRNADLWIVHCETLETRRLTFDPAADTSPAWSPDDQLVYFASARRRGDEKEAPYGGTKQVWAVPVTGGEAQPITRVKDGIDDFALSLDGRALYYTVSRDEQDDEWKALREAHAGVQYGTGKRRASALWKLDLRTWRAEKLIDDGRYIREFAVAPEQTRVALITTPDERLITNEGRSRVDVFDLRTRATATLRDTLWRELAPSPYGWLENLAWSADGGALAFTVAFDGYPSEVFVADWSAADEEDPDPQPFLWRLARPDEVYVTGGLRWKPVGRDLCFLADDRARSRVYCVTQVREGSQGGHTVMTPGDVVATSFDFRGKGGQVAAILANTEVPQDIFLAREVVQRSGDAAALELRRLTSINPQVDTWKLPQISIVSWSGANGDAVEGILELPFGYTPADGPLPMVVELHGGPTGATPYCLQYWIYGRTLMPAKGFALLSPNYRGSTGYGDRFLTDLIGRENDIEVRDILAGVDAMVQRGVADPERLAVMGWSNGGFLTNCLITTTDRFKAASSGAGVLDQLMQWGIQDTPGHNINYMCGLPWGRAEAYRAASPSWSLDRVRTPTLIHCGEGDERVPVQHSRMLHRALNEYVGVPTQLLVYPGQGHGLTTYKFRKAKMEWDVAWFERYVLGRGGGGTPAGGPDVGP